MLKSYEAIYDHGQFLWLGTPPDVDNARVIVTVLSPQVCRENTVPRHRQPPEELKSSTRILGDIVSSPCSEKEWEEMFDRTARQLAGDTEAFE
ncbi:MAG: hypothetical protein H7835_00055 [Magnetococcus sp. XQGC-1]